MENEKMLTLFMLLGYVLKFIFIIIPIIIIVLGTIDLVKYIITPSDNKNIKVFSKRLLIGISIFFVPIVISFIFNLINQNINNQVFKCFNNPNLCNEIINTIRNNKNCSDADNKNSCCKFILNNNKATFNTEINDCSIPISTLIND